MTVYVVTSGSYSDYGIRAVFVDMPQAENYVTEFNKAQTYEPACIEEFDSEDQINVVACMVYSVYLDLATGKINGQRACMEVRKPKMPTAVELTNRTRGIFVDSTISAEHAMKVATDWRQAWLREGPGEGRQCS